MLKLLLKGLISLIQDELIDYKWDVHARPHHCHPRGRQEADESPMSGDPLNKLPVLIPFLPVRKKIETRSDSHYFPFSSL